MHSDRVSIQARVLADSIFSGSRLTTMEVTFPRYTLAEFNTHRLLSRNSASSRAIPVWKKLFDVLNYPVIPIGLGKNKAGMQSSEGLSDQDLESALYNWLLGRDIAVIQACELAGGEDQIMKDAKGDPRAQELCNQVASLRTRIGFFGMKKLSVGIHKQHANRVLEPYSWQTVIVTGAHMRNFYSLRASINAQPEIQELAIAMAKAHSKSEPKLLSPGDWHLPLVFEEDLKELPDPEKLARISSARCARVSYLTHDGKRSLDEDFKMADKLQSGGHTSPFEHSATTNYPRNSLRPAPPSNFGDRWVQYRKFLKNEHDFSLLSTRETLIEGMKGDEALVDFVLSLPD